MESYFGIFGKIFWFIWPFNGLFDFTFQLIVIFYSISIFNTKAYINKVIQQKSFLILENYYPLLIHLLARLPYQGLLFCLIPQRYG